MTGPALLILLGAIISAAAAFWQNARTANERADFEKELRLRSDELRNKSDEIASLNQEIAKSQTELRAEVEKQVQLQQELRKRAEEQVGLQRELRLKRVTTEKR